VQRKARKKEKKKKKKKRQKQSGRILREIQLFHQLAVQAPQA
jgi:hypothetical protein